MEGDRLLISQSEWPGVDPSEDVIQITGLVARRPAVALAVAGALVLVLSVALVKRRME